MYEKITFLVTQKVNAKESQNFYLYKAFYLCRGLFDIIHTFTLFNVDQKWSPLEVYINESSVYPNISV